MSSRHLLALFSVLLLASCSKDNKDGDKKQAPMRSNVGNIHFDESANEAERGVIVAAIEHLNENRLLDADPQLLGILGVRTGDGPTVKSWLEERVQMVAGESFDTNRLVAVDSEFRYENPGVLPTSWRNRTRQEKGTLVMANYGALFYLLGKEHNKLTALNTKTPLGELRFTSPRTGFLVVGAGLLKVGNGKGHHARRAFQLATLLHEARHSDGNGLSLGFVHAKCPAGHDLEGVSACDEAGNGPYVIDSLAMKSMARTCGSCSIEDRNWMQGEAGDSFGRVLDKTALWNDQPEGRR